MQRDFPKRQTLQQRDRSSSIKTGGGHLYIFKKLNSYYKPQSNNRASLTDPRPVIPEQVLDRYQEGKNFLQHWSACLILNIHANASFSKMNVLFISKDFKLWLFVIIIFRINELEIKASAKQICCSFSFSNEAMK